MTEETLSSMEENTSSTKSLTSDDGKETAEALSAPRNFLSPTLNAVPKELLPERDAACEHCPNAQWEGYEKMLLGVCLVKNCLIFDSEHDDMPLMCDGMYRGQDVE